MVRPKADATKLHSWSFESYGAKVRIDSNSTDILLEAERVARHSLLSNAKTTAFIANPDKLVELTVSRSRTYKFKLDGEYLSSGRSKKKFFKFFDTIIRVSVAERAKNLVFVHAGVVGWRGKAILLPGDSFTGKSTLAAALVRNGADYYSDDFAIIDRKGLVRAFPRKISMRTTDGNYDPYELSLSDLGGSVGKARIPVGMVLFTAYEAGRRWKPKFLSQGEGILEMIPYVLSLKAQPEFSLKVLNNVTERAIIASSPRGNAEHFAKTLLGFFDKTIC